MTEPVFTTRTASEKASSRQWRRGYFFCPGCKGIHAVNISPEAPPPQLVWSFNENYVAPTLTPSIEVGWNDRAKVDGVMRNIRKRCHAELTNGVLKFLPDTNAHDLAGQEVPLPPIPEWFMPASN